MTDDTHKNCNFDLVANCDRCPGTRILLEGRLSDGPMMLGDVMIEASAFHSGVFKSPQEFAEADHDEVMRIFDHSPPCVMFLVLNLYADYLVDVGERITKAVTAMNN